MKKRVGIAIAICFALVACLALAACGGEKVDKTRYTGDWTLLEGSDPAIDKDSIQLMVSIGENATMTLNEDGTGHMTVLDKTLDITWEAKSDTEGTGTLNGQEMTLAVSDGKIVVRSSGGVSFAFVRPGSDEDPTKATSSTSASSTSASSTSAASSDVSSASASATDAASATGAATGSATGGASDSSAAATTTAAG